MKTLHSHMLVVLKGLNDEGTDFMTIHPISCGLFWFGLKHMILTFLSDELQEKKLHL